MAKLASGLQNPNGLTRLKPNRIPALLDALPIEELCGIGPKLKLKLNSLGIRICGELGRAAVSTLRSAFGRDSKVSLAAVSLRAEKNPKRSEFSSDHHVLPRKRASRTERRPDSPLRGNDNPKAGKKPLRKPRRDLRRATLYPVAGSLLGSW